LSVDAVVASMGGQGELILRPVFKERDIYSPLYSMGKLLGHASYMQTFLNGVAAVVERDAEWEPHVLAPDIYRQRGEEAITLHLLTRCFIHGTMNENVAWICGQCFSNVKPFVRFPLVRNAEERNDHIL
jgi:hypothetical protein